MSKPFDYVTDASFAKKNLMRGSENDELAEKDYNCWLANSAFSMHASSILHANLMNLHHNIPPRAQYEFYLYALPKQKRFAKWPKATKDEGCEAIRKFFNCSLSVAKQYKALLTKQQIAELVELTNTQQSKEK